MNAPSGRLTIWKGILSGLVMAAQPGTCDSAISTRHEGESMIREESRAYVPSRHIRADVIERESATTVSLAWTDPWCHYGEQTWNLVSSRESGVCALSGGRIRRGDQVFRPQARTSPINQRAMIIRSVIEELAPFPPDPLHDCSDNRIR
jgi:hypothetical protein